jgi:DNA-binding NarL/FixJ family response regulator
MIRLAVVEDQTLTRETTVERLGAGFGADVSVRGYANVEQMLAAGLDFDVVVLDLHLRGGGAENADAVRLVAQSSKVVILSGHESAEAVQRAVAAGALGYVSKESTDSIGTLARAIAHILGGNPYFDPELQDRIGAAARRQLSPRQQEVLQLEALGRTTRQIARALNLSEAGVRRHVERIIEIHPDCAKQADRVRLAVELGLVSPWEKYTASQPAGPDAP